MTDEHEIGNETGARRARQEDALCYIATHIERIVDDDLGIRNTAPGVAETK